MMYFFGEGRDVCGWIEGVSARWRIGGLGHAGCYDDSKVTIHSKGRGKATSMASYLLAHTPFLDEIETRRLATFLLRV